VNLEGQEIEENRALLIWMYNKSVKSISPKYFHR